MSAQKAIKKVKNREVVGYSNDLAFQRDQWLIGMPVDNIGQYLVFEYVTNDLITRFIFVKRNTRKAMLTVAVKEVAERLGRAGRAHHGAWRHHIFRLHGAKL